MQHQQHAPSATACSTQQRQCASASAAVASIELVSTVSKPHETSSNSIVSSQVGHNFQSCSRQAQQHSHWHLAYMPDAAEANCCDHTRHCCRGRLLCRYKALLQRQPAMRMLIQVIGKRATCWANTSPYYEGSLFCPYMPLLQRQSAHTSHCYSSKLVCPYKSWQQHRSSHQ